MKVAQITPYALDFSTTPPTPSYLCKMTIPPHTYVIVKVPASYRGREKNRYVRRRALEIWRERHG